MYGFEVGYVNQFFNILDSSNIREDENNLFDGRNSLNFKLVKVALQVVGIFSILFINIFSLGLFTILGAILQKYKIEKIKKNKFLNTLNKDQFHQWIPPLYFEKKNPILSNTNLEILKEHYDMGNLLSASLEWAFNDILKKPQLSLNKSKHILDKHKEKFFYQSNMNSVYYWMVYLMIKDAGLEYACDQKTLLVKLNDFFKIGSSNVCQVKEKNKIKVFYTYIDEWTPKDPSFYFGVDPVSLKLILSDLAQDPEAIKHLESLLLEGLISNSNPDLKSAKKFINSKSKKSLNIRNAYALIDELAMVLQKKYSKNFISTWNKLATNSQVYPPPSKKIKIPKRTFSVDLNLFFLHKKTLKNKICLIVIKIFVLIGLIALNIGSLGVISLLFCRAQNKKINHLNNKLSRFRKTRNVHSIFIKDKYIKEKSDLKYIPGNAKYFQKLYQNINIENTSNADKEMENLLQVAFKTSFNELLYFSKQKKYDIFFNKSDKILNQELIFKNWIDVYGDNKKALYLWMIYKLISFSELKKKKDQYLIFFSKNLFVANSKPCRIPKDDLHDEECFFLHQDSWTPKNNVSLNGIEPVSIKWLLEKIKKNSMESEFLEILILKALIPENSIFHKKLVRLSKECWHQLENVFLAYELLDNIAVALSNNYKDVFFNLWEEFTEKSLDEPLKKIDKTSFRITGQSKNWKFSNKKNFEKLKKPISQTRKLIAPIWNNIHKYRINFDVTKHRNLPHDFRDALYYLSSQYYWNHDNIDQAGCLFSSLAIHLLQSKKNLSSIKPKEIMNIMANYLNQLLRKKEDNELSKNEEENFRFFEIEISQATQQPNRDFLPWTIEEYIDWLKTSESPIGKNTRKNFDIGDLEIELFAKVFNIGIHVFISGYGYRLDNGLMMPIKVYGPNTKEKFILFNNPGFSFCPLMPKLKREPLTKNNLKEFSTINIVEDFWKKISRL